MEKPKVDGLILMLASEYHAAWTLVESGTGRVHRALGTEHAAVPGLYRTPLECNRGEVPPAVGTLERLPGPNRMRLCRSCRLPRTSWRCSVRPRSRRTPRPRSLSTGAG